MMDHTQSKAIYELFQTQPIAALGTLHAGHPFVSMTPFAILPDGSGFVIHVSRLATHTKDMMTNPHVSLLVMAARTLDVPPQAVARVTVQGEAKPCVEPSPGHADAKAAYLARFPESELMFGFADFSLFVIEPTSARFVGGFAQATSLSAQTLKSILAAAESG
jgi:putative heme iron utilization protein